MTDIYDFSLFDTQITAYVLLSWFLCLTAFVWLLRLFRNRRYLFIKPSMMVLVFSHIILQWPAALYAGYYETYFPDPFIFLFIISGYIYVGLAVSSRTFVSDCKQIWQRIVLMDDIRHDHLIKLILCLLGAIAAVVCIYLCYVPFQNTGLYAMYDDPLKANLIREESLKLLTSPFMKYVFSIMSSALVPLATGMIATMCMIYMHQKKRLKVALLLTTIPFLIFAVSLPGARWPAVGVLLVAMSTSMLKKHFDVNWVKAVIILALLLFPAVALTMIREDQAGEFQLLGKYFMAIIDRAFVCTLDTAAWHVQYVQENGVFGIAGIEKLALLFGYEPIDIPNYIGMFYFNTASTISATAGYLFSFYSYFGVWSLVLALIGLWFLDIAILVLKNLMPTLLLPTLAALSVSCLAFVQSDYLVVWISQGFGPILAISWFINETLCKRHSALTLVAGADKSVLGAAE